MSQHKGWSQLVDLIQCAEHQGQLNQLLQTLLSPDEQNHLSSRVLLIQALLQGKQPQRDIANRLNIGIATVTRGSNLIKGLTTKMHNFLKEQLC